MNHTAHGNKKATKFFQILQVFFLIICFVLINYLYIQHIKDNKIQVASGEEYAPRENYTFTPSFTTDSDYIEQPFQIGNAYLESIKIRLMLMGDTDGYMLHLMLCEDGNIIKEASITQHDFVDWSYYEFVINERLSKNRNYSLKIQQLPVDYSQTNPSIYHSSYVISNAASHVEGNSIYITNGENSDEELEVIYSYNYINKNMIIFLFFLDFFALFFIIFTLKNQDTIEEKPINRQLENFFYCFTPLLSFLIIECLTGNISGLTFEYYFKNLILYYLIYYVLLFLLHNFKIVTFNYISFFVILGLVYYFVLLFRGRPFMIQDIFSLQTAMTVAETYHYELPAKEVTVLMIYLCLSILLFNIKTDKPNYLMSKKCRFPAICTLVGFLFICIFYDGILTPINQFDLQSNYSQMGIVVTLISEIPYLKAKKPANYSVSAMNEILNKLETEETAHQSTTPQNIILIMNESFADFDYITKVDTDTELLPYWKNLRKNTISGYLNMPTWGAGTSNSEYKVLTGNSAHFLSSGANAYQMCVKANTFSLASQLKKQNFKTLAFHPFFASNYNRTTVYNHFGFEQFYSIENCWLKKPQYLRYYISDTSSYEEMIKKYESKTSNLFEFCVTMQNHGGYDAEDYVSTVKLNYDSSYPAAEQYLSILQESDLAFHHLINYFSNEEENTMIVMFGDHQPPIETGFYEELLGKPIGELTFEELQLLYVTPFVIWTNYDIEEKTNVRMSSNYFGSYIMQIAGLNMSAYNQFLLKMHEEIPIIGSGGICDANDVWYTWEEVPESYQMWINAYKIIQYNNVYDTRHRLDAFFEAD